MRGLGLTLLIAFYLLLGWVSLELPEHGQRDAPAHASTSRVGSPGAGNYYIEHAEEDAHTPNMVTVTLADYRGFDTLGETTVIFAAGIACYLILRRPRG